MSWQRHDLQIESEQGQRAMRQQMIDSAGLRQSEFAAQLVYGRGACGEHHAFQRGFADEGGFQRRRIDGEGRQGSAQIGGAAEMIGVTMRQDQGGER